MAAQTRDYGDQQIHKWDGEISDPQHITKLMKADIGREAEHQDQEACKLSRIQGEISLASSMAPIIIMQPAQLSMMMIELCQGDREEDAEVNPQTHGNTSNQRDWHQRVVYADSADQQVVI
ncbi:hypothetical protein [Aeromonas media]|uniref:hypothetical protein n=1 Tax=Aeromonas media TaxID=651 RepID=UPI00209C1D05|nr:hypothetical protein [Aeromonas media]